jgi:hypothetical protein
MTSDTAKRRSALLTLFASALIGASPPAFARPVSYEGGTTLILETDRDMSAVWLHHTPHHRLSLGYRGEWMRDDDLALHAAQATVLAHRGFGADHQSNLYLFAGAGVLDPVAGRTGEAAAAGYLGLMADWETRRWFLSYEARGLTSDDFGSDAMQAARVGVAPYVGGTGALHTWAMLEIDQRPERDHPIGATPLLRFFKGSTMVEIGYALPDDEAFFTLIQRF